MFDHQHYVPILRWKRAERDALRMLREDVRRRLTPLIELVPKDFDSSGKAGVNAIDKILAEKACQIDRSWGPSPIFVDLWLLDSEIRGHGGRHPLSILAEEMRKMKVALVPVTGLNRDQSYQTAVEHILTKDGAGLCLRVRREDVSSKDIARRMREIVSEFGVGVADVDLLVDFAVFASNDLCFADLCSRIPEIKGFRSFSISSGAFPENLTGLEVGQHSLPRWDWVSWRKQILRPEKLVRRPSFSDYTIQHGTYIEPPPFSNPSASIRYTADEHWVVMRGEGLRNEDGPGYAQYPANAELLLGRVEYAGADFSYGDQYIEERASHPEKPGSPETWLRAGFNHHLTVVVSQISNLFARATVGAP